MLRIPSNLDLAGAAPLLCAGITTYSPMRHWGVTKGKKVGVVGLGGLGHMGVKFAHAFGAHVVVFTTSPNKKEDALRLGADEVVVSRNADEMAEARRELSTSFSMRSPPSTTSMPISTCSRATGTSRSSARRRSHCPSRRSADRRTPQSVRLSDRRHRARPRRCSTSAANTTSLPTSKSFPIQKVNEAYERMVRSDVKYRFSIDMASLKSE